MRHVLRKTLLLMLPAVLLVGVVAAFASAASTPPNQVVVSFVSPSPAEGTTLTATNGVIFAFTYNRQPKATRTLTCTLAGPTASSGACTAPSAFGDKGSQSGKSYAGLANGSYTFTVSLTLTDGGAATAVRHFTVNVPVDRIYWGDCSSGCQMGRANRDGTSVTKGFITGGAPDTIATDSNYVYYSYGGSTISRANLDGTGVVSSFITGGAGVNGIALDGNHIYWTNRNANANLPPYGTIGRADLDGSNVNQSFMTNLINPTGIEVDGNYIYYTLDWNTQFFDGQIGRVALDGTTGRDDDFIDTGLNDAADVTVDSGHIYWTNQYSFWGSTHTIGRANLNGTGVNNSFITTSGDPYGIAVDANHIYWTINLVPFVTFTGIGRADLDGTNINNMFITTLFHPTGLALGSS
jgi:virginiamycin B lyase